MASATISRTRSSAGTRVSSFVIEAGSDYHSDAVEPLFERASRVAIARARAALAIAPLLCLLAACDDNGARRGVYSGTIEAVEVDIVPEVAGKLIERAVDQ